jgi:hypothetical protein
MIESPLLQEILAAPMHKTIVKILEARLGPVPQDIVSALQVVQDDTKLDDLIGFAATCPRLDAFRARLQELASSEPD